MRRLFSDVLAEVVEENGTESEYGKYSGNCHHAYVVLRMVFLSKNIQANRTRPATQARSP